MIIVRLRRRAILTLTFSLALGSALGSDLRGENHVQRQNGVTVALDPDTSTLGTTDKTFWDWSSFGNSQKSDLLQSIQAINAVDNHVDWEALRDKYIIATFTEPKEQGRRKLKRGKRRRRRKKGWKVAKMQEALEGNVATGSHDKKKGSKKHKFDDGTTDTKESTPNTQDELTNDTAVPDDGTSMLSDDETGVDDDASTLKDGVGGLINTTLELTDDLGGLMNATVAPSSDLGGPVDATVPPTNDPVVPVGSNLPPTNPPVGADDPTLGADSVLIPIYNYTTGNCPGAGSSPAAVPCAPPNLEQLCDKYSDVGKFSSCLNACLPSFCCIHDAPPSTNTMAPNCNTDVNCAQYAYCYIVWWKLHDTIGPATILRIEANDDFYDMTASEVSSLQMFFNELLFHHFKDSTTIIQLGTVKINDTLSTFNSDLIFLNDTYWNTTI